MERTYQERERAKIVMSDCEYWLGNIGRKETGEV